MVFGIHCTITNLPSKYKLMFEPCPEFYINLTSKLKRWRSSTRSRVEYIYIRSKIVCSIVKKIVSETKMAGLYYAKLAIVTMAVTMAFLAMANGFVAKNIGNNVLRKAFNVDKEFDYLTLALNWPASYCKNTTKCCKYNACCKGFFFYIFFYHFLISHFVFIPFLLSLSSLSLSLLIYTHTQLIELVML